MRAAPIDLRLSIPADARLAGMVRDVSAYGARQSGRDESDAEAFGRRAEGAFREAIEGAAAGEQVAMIVRLAAGPLEVVMTGERVARTLTLDD